MKKILFLIGLALCVNFCFSQGNWPLSGTKNRWGNGFGFSSKTPAQLAGLNNGSDSILMQVNRTLQRPVFRYNVSDTFNTIAYLTDVAAGNYLTTVSANTLTLVAPFTNFSVTGHVEVGSISATDNIQAGNGVSTGLISSGSIFSTQADIAHIRATSVRIDSLNLLTVVGHLNTGDTTTSKPLAITSTGTFVALSYWPGGSGSISGGLFTVTGTANQISATQTGGTSTVSLPSAVIVSSSISSANVYGTLGTAAQPNITSLGTLITLTVSGGISGTIAQAAQPNITSAGILTTLTVSGGIMGTIAQANQPNITAIGALTNLTVTGSANVSGILSVGGLTATGNVSTKSLVATGGVSAINLTITGNASVSGIISAAGVTTTGDISVTGKVITGTLSSGLATFGNGIQVTGGGGGLSTINYNSIDGLWFGGGVGSTADLSLANRNGAVALRVLSNTQNLSALGNLSVTAALDANSLTVTKTVTVGGGLIVTGGTFVAGSITRAATVGTIISGFTGSVSDLYASTPSGGEVWSNPTGTANLKVGSLGTGAVQATSGVLSIVSDGRLKIDKGTFTGALPAIMKLPKGHYYYWNKKSGLDMKVKQFSLFANEVHKVLGEEFAPTQNDGMYSLSDRALLSLTIQALQEANKKIDAQEARIAALEKLINK